MANLDDAVKLPVDEKSLALLKARTTRRRELGYREVQVPAVYLEALLELATKAVLK